MVFTITFCFHPLLTTNLSQNAVLLVSLKCCLLFFITDNKHVKVFSFLVSGILYSRNSSRDTASQMVGMPGGASRLCRGVRSSFPTRLPVMQPWPGSFRGDSGICQQLWLVSQLPPSPRQKNILSHRLHFLFCLLPSFSFFKNTVLVIFHWLFPRLFPSFWFCLFLTHKHDKQCSYDWKNNPQKYTFSEQKLGRGRNHYYVHPAEAFFASDEVWHILSTSEKLSFPGQLKLEIKQHLWVS